MKRLLAGLALCAAVGALSGCYYDPGYNYVRSNTYAGDAYYGAGTTAVYEGGYGYDAGVYPSYWYPAYGCCYGGGVDLWYGRTYYRGGRPGYWGHGYYGRGGYYGHGGYRGGGHWGGGGGHWSGGGHGGWHGH